MDTRGQETSPSRKKHLVDACLCDPALVEFWSLHINIVRQVCSCIWFVKPSALCILKLFNDFAEFSHDFPGLSNDLRMIF